MKPRLLLLACILAFPFAAYSQVTLQPVAEILFANVISKLSNAQKNQIASSLDFVLSGNADLPFALDKDSKDYPFGASVYPVDLNKDGREEMAVLFGNTFTSGMTGSSVSFFIKGADGKYKNHFGFPGMLPDALVTSSKGYPDLLIGGPGMEFPVWRWNGKTFVHHRLMKDSEYETAKKSSLEEISVKYQASLKK